MYEYMGPDRKIGWNIMMQNKIHGSSVRGQFRNYVSIYRSNMVLYKLSEASWNINNIIQAHTIIIKKKLAPLANFKILYNFIDDHRKMDIRCRTAEYFSTNYLWIMYSTLCAGAHGRAGKGTYLILFHKLIECNANENILNNAFNARRPGIGCVLINSVIPLEILAFHVIVSYILDDLLLRLAAVSVDI